MLSRVGCPKFDEGNETLEQIKSYTVLTFIMFAITLYSLCIHISQLHISWLEMFDNIFNCLLWQKS